jgi:hypothetical protein
MSYSLQFHRFGYLQVSAIFSTRVVLVTFGEAEPDILRG